MSLLAHRHNVYSQVGEDGIIETIFRAIGETTRWCCEFGAWDGLHHSNTRRLVDAGWNAVLIEGDPDKFVELRQNNASNPRVIPVRAMVDSERNRLESILADAGAPELDLLVIDIDGPDYEIFESLQIRPRVICVEVVPDTIQRVVRLCLERWPRKISGNRWASFTTRHKSAAIA